MRSSRVPRLDNIMNNFCWIRILWTDRWTDDGEFNSPPSSLREAGDKKCHYLRDNFWDVNGSMLTTLTTIRVTTLKLYW